MKKFDFFIVGVQKGGTTALAEFLKQHQRLHIPEKKELHIFDKLNVYSESRVEKDFSKYLTDKKLLHGDATPIYIYYPHCIDYLRSYNPNAKIIVILRNPIERAISHYAMEKSRRREYLPLSLAILFEPVRNVLSKLVPILRSNHLRRHSYIDRGRYSEQIEKLYEHFPKEQVLILHNEDLKYSHKKTLNRVYEFLSVERPQKYPKARQIFAGNYKKKISVPSWLNAHMKNVLSKEIEFTERFRMKSHGKTKN